MPDPDLGGPGDASLVARAQQGDRSAFRDLYLSTAPEVFAYARRRLPHHEAEDVTAETFARAWRSLHTYRQQGRPFTAWLIRICQRAMIDRLPREPNGRTAEVRVGPEPFDELYARDDAVAGALAALPDRQRSVLVLRFVRDLAVADVANAMGLTPAGVRALTYRALEGLRDRLGDLVPAWGAPPAGIPAPPDGDGT